MILIVCFFKYQYITFLKLYQFVFAAKIFINSTLRIFQLITFNKTSLKIY